MNLLLSAPRDRPLLPPPMVVLLWLPRLELMMAVTRTMVATRLLQLYLARKRPPASAPAPPPREDERLLPGEMAEIELREYGALEELPRVFLPNRETGEVPLCVTHHWTDLKFCHVIGRIS